MLTRIVLAVVENYAVLHVQTCNGRMKFLALVIDDRGYNRFKGTCRAHIHFREERAAVAPATGFSSLSPR